MLKNSFWLVVGVLSPSLAIASSNEAINATVLYGVDSNPHQLSSNLLVTEQNYAEVEFKARKSFFKTVYLSAKANKTQYIDDRRGDQYNLSANISLKSSFKIKGEKFKYKFSVNARNKDKTYVSKSSGLVATFGGQSIADRYDSNQTNSLVQLSYLPYKNLTFDFIYRGRDKSYQQYNIAGLSNLDYQQQKIQLGMLYKASEVGRFYVNGTHTERSFVDKRIKDLDGIDLLNTDLAYTYQAFNIGYIYHPESGVRWKYSFNLENREDNGSGYYNALSGYLAISGKHQFGVHHYFNTRIRYSNFILVNQIEPGLTVSDEETSGKQGISISVGYEWVIATLFETNFALYLDLEHANYTNANDIYTYDRNKLSLGIRWSAF